MLSNFIPENIQNQIKEHCRQDLTKESCGVVVETLDKNLLLLPSENVAKEPQNDFKVNPETQLEAYSLGTIKAVYHSHISEEHSGYLSAFDIRKAKENKISYLLYHTAFDCWDYFDPELTENPFPLELKGDSKTLDYYLNWRWEWDRSDCWSLVRGYYKGMLEIELEDYVRPTLREIYKAGWNAFEDNLESRGFQKFRGKPDKHDLVVMRIQGSNPHHIGVMIDDLRMLHLYDESHPSCLDRWEKFESSISSFWRYKS